jgi:PAS domain-containing protein
MTLAMQLAGVAQTLGPIDSLHSARASSSDLERAVLARNFALVVWDAPHGSIHLANQAAAELLGEPLSALPGRRVSDLIAPRDSVEDVVTAIGSKVVEDTRTERQIRSPEGGYRNVRVWSRTVELAETRFVVSLIIPSTETARLGRDPAAPWRDLAPVAVGITDGAWRIEQVSRDIQIDHRNEQRGMHRALAPGPGSSR